MADGYVVDADTTDADIENAYPVNSKAIAYWRSVLDPDRPLPEMPRHYPDED